MPYDETLVSGLEAEAPMHALDYPYSLIDELLEANWENNQRWLSFKELIDFGKSHGDWNSRDDEVVDRRSSNDLAR